MCERLNSNLKVIVQTKMRFLLLSFQEHHLSVKLSIVQKQ